MGKKASFSALLLDRLKNIFLGIDEHSKVCELKELRKIKFFHFCSLLAVLIFIGYGIIHFIVDNHIILAVTDMACAAVLVANLVFYRMSCRLNIATSVALLVTAFLFISTIIYGGFIRLGIIWVLCFPLLSFYMRGIREGLIFTVLFMICYLALLGLDFLKMVDTPYDIGSFLYLLAAYIVISIFTYFYEDTNAKSEAIIEKQVYTDQLTGLFNRLQLIKDTKIEKDIKLIIVNIDDFKGINDLYGSRMGDLVLLELTKMMKNIQKSEKKVFRLYKLHADEFAVVLKGARSKKEIINFINTINASLMREMTINNTEIVVSITCGVADHKKDLLTDADIALKLAKDQKKHFVYFNDAVKLDEKYKENMRSLRNLKKAIVTDGVTPYFQPILNNTTGKIEKYECLMRLLVDDTVLTPIHFMEIAKRSKIYPHLTKTMMDKSFKEFKESDYEFSVNISVDDINNDDTVEFIMETLKYYNIPKRAVFEIIESEKIEDDKKVSDFIRRAKSLGCRIAIDDFGAGYSNFDYILRMNVDYVKIDSSLVKNIDKDTSSQILAETIVNFSKKMNIRTIAEFVHSREVFEKVKELEIDYSQGYYIGKPGPSIV